MLDQVSKKATNDSSFVIHESTNDIQKSCSEKLFDNYHKFIQQYMTKSNNIPISLVLSMIPVHTLFYSKTFTLNNDLETLCREHSVELLTCGMIYIIRLTCFREMVYTYTVGSQGLIYLIHPVKDSQIATHQ